MLALEQYSATGRACVPVRVDVTRRRRGVRDCAIAKSECVCGCVCVGGRQQEVGWRGDVTIIIMSPSHTLERLGARLTSAPHVTGIRTKATRSLPPAPPWRRHYGNNLRLHSLRCRFHNGDQPANTNTQHMCIRCGIICPFGNDLLIIPLRG